MKTKINKFLCFVVCAGIFCSVLPMGCFAEASDTHWASDTVNALNELYEAEVFSADDTEITKNKMKEFLNEIGWKTATELESEEKLTRAEVCEILAEVFRLPKGDNSAIEYLYSQGIINGYETRGLEPDGGVSFAQLALLSYRIIRAVGGGLGNQAGLKPGTPEYFAYSYFRARSIDIDTEGGIDLDTWEGWIYRLRAVSPEGELQDFNCDYPYEDNEISQLSASVDMVNAYINVGGADTVFTDVSVDEDTYYYYDGVMYLFNMGIVRGTSEGEFDPKGEISRATLPVLLSRVLGVDGEGFDSNAWAVENGYMLPPEENAEEWWQGNLTREEAITAIMKATEADISNVNPAVLERFADKDNFPEEISPYIVYAVMLGLVKGYDRDGAAYLGLDGTVSRGDICVLLYRTLLGIDNTKMLDYRSAVSDILSSNQE